MDGNVDAWFFFPAGIAVSDEPFNIRLGGWDLADCGELGICNRRSLKVCGPIWGLIV